MEDLKELSCKKLGSQLKQHWISDTFTDCVREIYQTSREMRAIVTKVSALHKKEFLKKLPFQELIRDTGDFALDLVLAITDESDFIL
jgi:hypothetical protein